MYYSLWFPFVSNLHLTLLVRGHASSLCSLLTDKMRWSDTCTTCPKANFPLLHHLRLVWWPTTVTAKPKTSRQNKNITAKPKTSRQNKNITAKPKTQKPHGKNKIPRGKNKNITAKPNASQQKKNSFNWFCRGYWLWPWSICMVFLLCIWFCREVFGFAVRFLVLSWKLWATVLFVPESLL